MSKKTFGQVMKDGRDELRLTQRELAGAVGVRAGHIAYLEKDQRRPSLWLLRRIAKALSLDSQQLLLLAHPDAKHLIHGFRSKPPKRDAWHDFVTNRAVLKSHRVSRDELDVLKRVNMHNRVSCARHFLFILNAIRQAAEPKE